MAIFKLAVQRKKISDFKTCRTWMHTVTSMKRWRQSYLVEGRTCGRGAMSWLWSLQREARGVVVYWRGQRYPHMQQLQQRDDDVFCASLAEKRRRLSSCTDQRSSCFYSTARKRRPRNSSPTGSTKQELLKIMATITIIIPFSFVYRPRLLSVFQSDFSAYIRRNTVGYVFWGKSFRFNTASNRRRPIFGTTSIRMNSDLIYLVSTRVKNFVQQH